MKRLVTIVSVVILLVWAALLHTSIKNFFWVHPWWHSALVAIPTIVLGLLEVRHNREANRLRAELDTERNKELKQIAKNIERPVTQAEKNAETLRRHLRSKVAVSEGQGNWPSAPEIVEVSEDHIVTLFTPRDYSSTNAWCVGVHCTDLEITDIPLGSCPLRLKVLKRYGSEVPLGEITRWEDRLQAAANPSFAKGGAAYYAKYIKQGSPETRSLYVYASADGANSFLLEASTGERSVADNKEVSKRFMVLHIDYQAEGFQRTASGTGSNPHRLFIC